MSFLDVSLWSRQTMHYQMPSVNAGFQHLYIILTRENVSAALVMMACGAAPIWLHDAVRVGCLAVKDISRNRWRIGLKGEIQGYMKSGRYCQLCSYIFAHCRFRRDTEWIAFACIGSAPVRHCNRFNNITYGFVYVTVPTVHVSFPFETSCHPKWLRWTPPCRMTLLLSVYLRIFGAGPCTASLWCRSSEAGHWLGSHGWSAEFTWRLSLVWINLSRLSRSDFAHLKWTATISSKNYCLWLLQEHIWESSFLCKFSLATDVPWSKCHSRTPMAQAL